MPFKVCTLNCIYCESGRTTNITLTRQSYVPADEVVTEVASVLKEDRRIDYITLSGSGEPTLNSGIAHVIQGVKKITSIPVAVLTNGTLLYDGEVRKDLMASDVVLPSLDAVSAGVFRNINRPHPSLDITRIIEGLIQFRREYSGDIWLEIMFAKGVNDSPDEIRRLKEAVDRIDPDKIQLNTVVRPPAESDADALSIGELMEIQKVFANRCEVIAGFQAPDIQSAYQDNLEDAILALVARRPVTIEDMAKAFGVHRNELIKCLGVMKNKGAIVEWRHNGDIFYVCDMIV